MLTVLLLVGFFMAAASGGSQQPIPNGFVDDIPLSIRNYWMRMANDAAHLVYDTPCALYPFGSVIVNHAGSRGGELGELICIGANDAGSGNPTLHGEMAAINNCSAILSSPTGLYDLTDPEILNSWANLLYTNAEPCPMCASAIRWAGFKEMVFGTSIKTLVDGGWSQINISSEYVFSQSTALGTRTDLLGGILTNETDVSFGWQFDGSGECPQGCAKNGRKCQQENVMNHRIVGR